MITKTFEIRDASTFIPVLAVKMVPGCESDRYLLGRSGFGTDPDRQAEYILVVKIDGGDGKSNCDPYGWAGGARTMRVAHAYIQKNWDALESGAVVDVEFIQGEKPNEKRSEAFE